MPSAEKLFSRARGCCKISRAKDVENFSKEHQRRKAKDFFIKKEPKRLMFRFFNVAYSILFSI